MGGAAGGARGRGDGLGPPCRARRVADRDLASRARRRGGTGDEGRRRGAMSGDRKSTRLNSSHTVISYAVFCLKKKKRQAGRIPGTSRHIPRRRGTATPALR